MMSYHGIENTCGCVSCDYSAVTDILQGSKHKHKSGRMCLYILLSVNDSVVLSLSKQVGLLGAVVVELLSTPSQASVMS